MSETQPCTTMFSNGTEYEWFIETNCERDCKRFRKGKCAILRRLEMARFDKKYFPYDSLLDFTGGYAGKVCKLYTTEPLAYTRISKQLPGQLAMELTELLKEEET